MAYTSAGLWAGEHGGWCNEAGEPIMSGEAYRYEQALNEQDDAEREYDRDDETCRVCHGYCYEDDEACQDACACGHQRHEHDDRCYHGPSFYHPNEKRCNCLEFDNAG